MLSRFFAPLAPELCIKHNIRYSEIIFNTSTTNSLPVAMFIHTAQLLV